LRQGITAQRIHFVGNVMIDTLRHNLQHAVPHTQTFAQYGAPASWGQRGFAVLTSVPTSAN